MSVEPITSLCDFINASPTPFHAVEQAAARLSAHGFKPLCESADWSLSRPGRYYVVRNQRSLVAFALNAPPESGLRMLGAHTDSPGLRVKPHPCARRHGFLQLAVEVYGGALLHPWFDRDLSLAGRVVGQRPGQAPQSWLIDFARPIAFLPSLAIHLNRRANESSTIDPQKHLPPLLARLNIEREFPALLGDQLRRQYDVEDARILGFELCLYDTQPARLVGLDNEFIAAARLDNLLSCEAAAHALCNAQSPHNCLMVLNDHEEIGSVSAEGADGAFLQSVLERVCGSSAVMRRALAQSWLLSVDNAHGVHPNYADRHEPGHRPLLNGGPVLKYNANQRYATDSLGAAMFHTICAERSVPYQKFTTRSDLACGSTIGPLTAAQLGVRTVDVGVAQLGMHSIRELAGAADVPRLRDVLQGFSESIK